MTIDITGYAGLQTSIIEIMERTGYTAFANNVPSAIKLGEAKLNRMIPALIGDHTLTGTANNRRITTGLSIAKPVALFLAESGKDEEPITLDADGTFPYLATADRPSRAAFDENNTYIDFDVPLSDAFPFRLRAATRLALATTSPNWLLTNHPDVYLAASIVWGFTFQEDIPNFARWKGLLEEAIPEIQTEIMEANRGYLEVGPELKQFGRGGYNIETDD